MNVLPPVWDYQKAGEPLKKPSVKFSHSLSQQSLGVCSGPDMEVCAQEKTINQKQFLSSGIPHFGIVTSDAEMFAVTSCTSLGTCICPGIHTLFLHKNSFGIGAKDCQLSYIDTHAA